MNIRAVIFAWACLCACGSTSFATDKAAVPTYTNEDLRRLSALRSETGVESVATVPAPAGSAKPDHPVHGEDYWRREADRLHDRLRTLRQRADDLRFRLERPARPEPQTRTVKGRRPAQRVDPTPELRARLAAIEDEMRDRQDRFEERARREGALPGWIR